MLALQYVQYIPKELAAGVLYVSREYAVAAHLCACGCGNKVVTALGPAEWSLTERNGLPTLRPSIGNWQLPCRTHYLITNGQIQWAGNWSDAQVLAGRQAEDRRRQAYFAERARERSFWRRLWKTVRRLFGSQKD